MRYTRVHRLLRIITLIQSGRGWNAERLAAACQTTVRTIYRDLNMLEGAGIPYHFDEIAGCYRIRRDFFLPPMDLTLDEALALMCLAECAADQEQIPFIKPAARAVNKIVSQLPLSLRQAVEDVDAHIEMRLAASMPADGVADVYEIVRKAIAKRRILCCTYESARKADCSTPSGNLTSVESNPDISRDRSECHPTPTTHQEPEKCFFFAPYCLFYNQRAWYAIGYHESRNEVRSLKLNRFTGLEATDQGYVIPEGFSLQDHFGKAWRMIPGNHVYSVELHFDAKFAETIADTHWHDTQEIEWQEDGSILFRCEVDGLDEIVWWVLSMGPHCVVRQPRELVKRVKELSQQTASKYL